MATAGCGLLHAELSRAVEGGAEGDFLQEPRKRERDDSDQRAPKEDPGERGGECVDEIGLNRRRAAFRLRRIKVGPAANAGGDGSRQV
jgi:hypothetical protein